MSEEEKRKEAARKALDIYLSGKQTSGRGTEIDQKELSKEEKDILLELTAPVSTKDLKVRGRQKGVKTPRQTFRIDESLWRSFQKKCRSKESKSASQVLREFISRYTHGGD